MLCHKGEPVLEYYSLDGYSRWLFLLYEFLFFIAFFALAFLALQVRQFHLNVHSLNRLTAVARSQNVLLCVFLFFIAFLVFPLLTLQVRTFSAMAVQCLALLAIHAGPDVAVTTQIALFNPPPPHGTHAED